MTLPNDVSRCAGFLGDGHERCTRRFDCARFVERAGPNSPFAMSACEGGDAFIHAATVAEHGGADHPQGATPVKGPAMRAGAQTAGGAA